MPTRQDTFKLVPTTLVNTTGPRPPMTSKAAKKAYREANKLPKVSKAEQRRIDAAEIARQKKEYEKEKAAAKAKAAREKKQKKEAEERAKRKELGLPEPNRFVRPSQPTIKTFVKSGAGRKRSLGEVESIDEGHTDIRNGKHKKSPVERETRNPAKRVAVVRKDEDDEFGDFPSLSQADLPTLFVEQDDKSHTVSMQSSPNDLPSSRSQSQLFRSVAAEHVSVVYQAKLGADVAESQLLAGASTTAPSQIFQSLTVTLEAPSSSRNKETNTLVALTTIPEHHNLKTPNSTVMTNGLRMSVVKSPGTMPPPIIPMTVNRLRSRIPLQELSRDTMPSLRSMITNPITSTNGVDTKFNRRLRRENAYKSPPSTLAFLEAHLDDFFPSPSQQVRELLEDVDDMPSNTQIAREIDLDQTSTAAHRVPHTSALLPPPQVRIEGDSLCFLSSQDLEISSQDLRDMDTPSRAMPRGGTAAAAAAAAAAALVLQHPKSRVRIINEVEHAPAPVHVPLPPTPKLKPRFFEEKEDDLLRAALHESLLLSRQTTQGSSPRRSRRILRRTQSLRTDLGCGDDYGSDGSDLDADLLALLDGV